MLLKLLVGMLEMVKTVGWSRIPGVKIGDKMVSGNLLINSRCILMNQE
jgi:hypothetical protein